MGQLGDDFLVGRGGSDLLDGGFGFDTTIDARELSRASTGVDTVRGQLRDQAPELELAEKASA